MPAKSKKEKTRFSSEIFVDDSTNLHKKIHFVIHFEFAMQRNIINLGLQLRTILATKHLNKKIFNENKFGTRWRKLQLKDIKTEKDRIRENTSTFGYMLSVDS